MLAYLCVPASAQNSRVAIVERSMILVDGRYADDPKAAEMLKPYKHVVDSVMSPVLGRTAKYMKAHAPESELSNLLSDIMVWCGTKYNEKVELGLYNLGGIRAALPEGVVTFGDVLDVAPFDNKICFVTLTGEQTRNLFRHLVKGHGAGISSGWVVTVENGELASLKYEGREVEDGDNYRIATIDYLLTGSDGFKELRNATNVNKPTDEKSNTRFLITDYFRDKTAKGEVVDAFIEGRVIIK